MQSARITYILILLIYPFCLLPIGGFQLSTVALVASFVLFLFHGWRYVVAGRAVYACLLFYVYAVLVNTAWYYVSGSEEFLLHSAYLLVTGIMFFCSVMMGRSMSSRDANQLIVLLFASVAVQLVVIFVDLGVLRELVARQSAFFNNPNQLAYFVAVCAAIVLMLSHLYKVESNLVLATCILALAVSVFTASLAGVAVCLIYVFIAIFQSPILKGGTRVLAVSVLCAAVLLGFEQFMSIPTHESLNARAEVASDQQETSEQLRYNTELLYSDNLIWGSGEGVFDRFDSDIEQRSYIGTLLVSYGVTGSILFLWFLRSAIPDWRCFVFLVPLLAYNLMYSGGRSLMLWAMFGLMAAATLPAIKYKNEFLRSKKRRHRRSRPQKSVSDVDIVL